MAFLTEPRLASINLFRGYNHTENEQTHAFLAFLNLLMKTDRQSFLLFWQLLKTGIDLRDASDVEIDCQDYEFGTWDGQIRSKRGKWFLAIEAKVRPAALKQDQLKRHIRNLRKRAKSKLLLLTPFDRRWIVREFLNGRSSDKITYLSWGEVYNSASLVQSRSKDRSLGFIVDEYKTYLQVSNHTRAGIIQILNPDYIDEQYIKKCVQGKHDRWHVPSKRMGFDVPGFTVFAYDKSKGGICAHFVSKGMHPENQRDQDWNYYFRISNFVELKNSISVTEIRKMLGKMDHKFRHFKRNNCPAPYYVLDKEMVEALALKCQSKK